MLGAIMAGYLSVQGAQAIEQMPMASSCSLEEHADVAGCIARNRRPVDYGTIVDKETRVLVLGEAHATAAHKDELRANLAQLAKLGFTDLTYEAMPSSKQRLITGYRAGRVTRKQLSREIFVLWGYKPKPYVRVIDAALKRRMNVWFMDRDREYVDLTLPNWKELELAVERRREAHWVAEVAGILERNPHARIVMLVGSGHVSSVQSQLDHAGIGNKSVIFDGGEFIYDSVLTEAARVAKVQGMRFMVKTDPGGSDSGDYHVHLPQSTNAIIIRRHH
jgi:hypothetical protein